MHRCGWLTVLVAATVWPEQNRHQFESPPNKEENQAFQNQETAAERVDDYLNEDDDETECQTDLK